MLFTFFESQTLLTFFFLNLREEGVLRKATDFAQPISFKNME